MKLISENLHIISKNTKEAVKNRDELYIKNLLKRQIAANPDWIDLNIGPARGAFAGAMEWIVNIASEMTDIPLSLDTTNIDEIESGLKLAKNPQNWIINSTSADFERLEAVTDVAVKYNANIIALTMNSELGIPKESDGRLELAFEINEKTQEKGIENEKIFFDPLILPVAVEQSQAVEALNTIRMLKESFEPPVLTTIGLSNVSNGAPAQLRPLINRVFFVLAAGCGLDSAIVDSFDTELLRINGLLENQTPENAADTLILSIYETMRDFGEIDDVACDLSDRNQMEIFKTARVLLNKTVYTNSYLEI